MHALCAFIQVDVIVNTASKDLNLNQGAVSNSILQAAGANLQTECKTKMPNGLSPGQILITTGCSLQCKNVYHGACEQWDGGKGKAEKVRNTATASKRIVNISGNFWQVLLIALES